MTSKIKTLLIGAAGAVALTACTPATWHQEAGAFIDEGGFGNPTMQNMLAQMCTGQPKGYIVPDPVVGLRPKGGGPTVYARYSVYCHGHLNGKYAEVIFQEYVRSATAPQQLGAGGLQALDTGGGG